MGLFSFVGKALGGIVKTAVGFIPGPAGSIARAGLGLLSHKGGPGTSSSSKLHILGRYPPNIARGNVTQGGYGGGLVLPGIAGSTRRIMPSPAVLRLSPVLPGGAVATKNGPAPRTSSPPTSYAGSARGTGKRKRSRKRSSAKSSRKRSSRKLKFGSPAWRKKYMKKSRGRRKRAA